MVVGGSRIQDLVPTNLGSYPFTGYGLRPNTSCDLICLVGCMDYSECCSILPSTLVKLIRYHNLSNISSLQSTSCGHTSPRCTQLLNWKWEQTQQFYNAPISNIVFGWYFIITNFESHCMNSFTYPEYAVRCVMNIPDMKFPLNKYTLAI